MPLTLFQTSPDCYVSAVSVFENPVGKEEIARNGEFGEFYAIFIKVKIIVCKFFQSERV